MLVIKNLFKSFPISSFFSLKKQYVQAVNDVSLEISKGEIFALVGESGSGKSTLGRCILKILEPTKGNISFENTDITFLSDKKMLPFRQKMQVVFQDPFSSLNPRMTIREIIGEALIEHKLVSNTEELFQKVDAIAKRCGIDSSLLDRFPHQFSGGQRQRIGIARALALNPSFLICDEAVSALDVSIKAQIIQLLQSLNKEYNLTLLFISHDMKVVKFIADKVAVMYLGKIVEIAPKNILFTNAKHPYTISLLQASISNVSTLEGEIPSNINLPKGCVFASRCPFAQEKCLKNSPPMQQDGEHYFACFFPVNDKQDFFDTV